MSRHDEIRVAAESSLLHFIRLVSPHRVLGQCHIDLTKWWTRDDAQSHQLVLYPRDHQKSTLIAYRVAWALTRDPTLTFLYISSTANLAEKQLRVIKDIFLSPIYRRYWPEMVKEDEGQRKRWTNSEIIVDHPKRMEMGIADPTIFTGGLTTSLTGFHCNVAVLDDVVVNENAYTKEGREKVKNQYSLLASIESTDAEEWVVGTRYHPDDLYGEMQLMTQDIYDEAGNLVSKTPIYEIMQREVEDRGDGSGDYLWPRQARQSDGKWFGFNQQILATKRGQYLDKTQFRAQYYNNPNDPDNEAIAGEYFQYYDKKFLERSNGVWKFNGKLLNIFAALDMAYSLTAKADYSAIAVVGINEDGDIYVLDLDRFKVNKPSEYYKRVRSMYDKWGFRKLRSEVTAGQEPIVEAMIDLIKMDGLSLSIDRYRPNKTEGVKEERIQAALAPRYENRAMWHYQGGLIYDLEEELRQARPRNDDLKDALANAVQIAVAPIKSRNKSNVVPITYHPRFGGVSL